MSLAKFVIKYPVFLTMQVLAVVVLGFFAWTSLGVDLMPDIEFPFVVIQTIYPGAGASEIESDVTDKIEEGVSGVEGIKEMQSISGEGYSLIFIEFELDVDAREAESDVRSKMARVTPDLPENIETPIVARFDPFEEPILIYGMRGPTDEEELRRLADDVLKPQLERISGVAAVDTKGGYEREVTVECDPTTMAAYGVTVEDISRALTTENLDIPAGSVRSTGREEKLRVFGKLRTANDIESIVVSSSEDGTVYLRDVARVDIKAHKERDTLTKLNGTEAVSFSVARASGANIVDVAESVKKEVEKIKGTLPEGTEIILISDDSEFIEDSVGDTMHELYFAFFFAAAVILIFLGNIRTTVISAFAVPMSILFAFIAMQALGYTMNIITLLSLSLAVGILIDDAIVVRENIYRHWEEGEPLEEAAVKGTNEVALAVLATTFTICAVFVPIANMGGIVGRFFTAFGVTITVAVLYSLWDAMTMAPMMSAKFFPGMDVAGKKNWFEKMFEPINRQFVHLAEWYRGALGWALNHRPIIIILAIVLFAASLGMIYITSKEFMPAWDESIFWLDVETPIDSSLAFTEKTTAEIDDYLRTLPEVETTFAEVGVDGTPNKSSILVKLVDPGKRDLSSQEMVEELRGHFANYTRANLVFLISEMGPQGQPIEVTIQGPDFDKLEELSDNLVQVMSRMGGTREVTTSLKPGRPELRVVPDRAMCREMGVSIATVAMTLRSLIEGNDVTKFTENGEDYDVRVMIPRAKVRSVDDVERIYVRDFDGDMIPLSVLVKTEKAFSPIEINHVDRARTISVSCGYAVGTTTGDIEAKIGKYKEENPPPEGYNYKKGWSEEMMGTMFAEMLKALFLALIFVYIVLASQFNSFLHPFTIMAALPLSVVGAFAALFLTGTTLNIMTMIGIILLMGIVNKNAILLVDFTLKKIQQGLSMRDALLTAGPIRMRPILMTSAAMIMGMMPVAIGLGKGSEMRSPMAIAVIGGLITSTALTLIVVPVVFTYLENMRRWFKRRRAAEAEVVRDGFE
jgi:HAE1 family hydrophobic/amphiphilic exporter-1